MSSQLLSKEEILNDLIIHVPMTDDEITKIIYTAMDKYAQSIAVDFARFTRGSITPIYVPTINGVWELWRPQKLPTSLETITDDEMFAIYLQSKQSKTI